MRADAAGNSEPRLREAPVPVALHRYVEGIVGVNRKWPVELSRKRTGPEIWARRLRAVDEVERFLRRATEDGLLRAGQPDGWAGHERGQLLHLTSRELPDLSDARAADVIVDTFLRGFGAGEHQRGEVDNFGVGGIEPRSREKTARK